MNSVSKIDRLLTERTWAKADRLRDACVVGAPADRTGYHVATLDFSLCAIARYHFTGPKPELLPLHRPAWLSTGQAELVKYVAEDPEARSDVMRSIFFSQRPGTLRRLHRITSALLPQTAEESGFNLAVRLVSGEVNIDFERHYEELRRAARSHKAA